MKKMIFLCFIISYVHAMAQTAKQPTMTDIYQSINIETDQVFDQLVDIRRKFHAHPELAGNEINTQAMIIQYLQDLGIEVKKDVFGFGIVGILKGAHPGKHIAWRADMDALPHDFPDDVTFQSTTPGVQHGCGHDVHMAIGLGIATILVKHKNDLHGTVYFIFQPEEESFTGAKGMIDHGLFQSMHIDEIYSLHVTPFPIGQIMVKANELYAYQKGVRIKLKGRSTESEAAALLATINSGITRTINHSQPWDISKALDPQEGLTNVNTIFKDYRLMDKQYVYQIKDDTTILDFDLYETNKKRLHQLIPDLHKVIDGLGLSSQVIDVSFFKENPTIDNDAELTSDAVDILHKHYGPSSVTMDYGQVPFSNDDFAFFQQKSRGVYFFLGASNFAKGMIAMIHAPHFMVDEECIRLGVNRFATLLYERSNK